MPDDFTFMLESFGPPILILLVVIFVIAYGVYTFSRARAKISLASSGTILDRGGMPKEGKVKK